MPSGVLTLETGSRFWFEGEVWEVDTVVGDQVRLRRDATVRSVSTSALLEAASPLDEPEEGHGAQHEQRRPEQRRHRERVTPHDLVDRPDRGRPGRPDCEAAP